MPIASSRAIRMHKTNRLMKYKCVDCGTIFDDTIDSCPNCGCPTYACEEYFPEVQNIYGASESNRYEQPKNQSDIITSDSVNKDWANYIYECGALYWETFSKRYVKFKGRSSRTEYWSFAIISLLFGLSTGIGIFIIFLPFIGVSIRRMHDINKCGWWSICPIACFFLYLKKSDKGRNKYGLPQTYNHIFSHTR